MISRFDSFENTVTVQDLEPVSEPPIGGQLRHYQTRAHESAQNGSLIRLWFHFGRPYKSVCVTNQVYFFQGLFFVFIFMERIQFMLFRCQPVYEPSSTIQEMFCKTTRIIGRFDNFENAVTVQVLEPVSEFPIGGQLRH